VFRCPSRAGILRRAAALDGFDDTLLAELARDREVISPRENSTR